MQISLSLTQMWNKNAMKSLEDTVKDVVRFCANKYKFDENEVFRELCFSEDGGRVARGGARGGGLGARGGARGGVDKKKKMEYPLPFNRMVDETCCRGLKKNHGLYTQCNLGRKVGDLCKTCSSKKTPYGRVEDRMSQELLEYTDGQGNKVVSYMKVLEKLKIDAKQVKSENPSILEVHFEVVLEQEQKKGRPRKEEKVMECKEEIDDLFEELVAGNVSDDEVVAAAAPRIFTVATEETMVREHQDMESNDVDVVEVVTEVVAEVVVTEVVTEKAAPKEKVVKEKAAPKEKVVKEKAAPKEKVVKEKAAAKAKGAAKEKVVKVAKKEEEESEEEEEEEPDVCVRFEFKGTKYLKSKLTGTIYNMQQDVLGMWNENTKDIDFKKDSEELEEESDDESA